MPKRSSAPEVYKFGGASLADGESYRHAAGIIAACKAPLAVVCSASAGVTDALLAVAESARRADGAGVAAGVNGLRAKHAAILKAIFGAKVDAKLRADLDAAWDELLALAEGLKVVGDLTARTSDLVVSRGERVSAKVMAAALRARGVRAEYVDALEVVVTDGPFGAGAPNLAETDKLAKKRLRPLVVAGAVPVVPGFLGAYHEAPGQPPALATLGRGGSDLTATLLARALGAARVSLWKDVPGLLTADPRVVPDARVIPQMGAREAAELAYFGAKVLHPRALIPLSDRDIPVFVRPFVEPAAPGTEISGRRTLDDYPVKALSAMGGQALVTVTGRGLLGVPGVAARTFAALSQKQISVSLITQSSSEQSITFTVPEKEAAAARASLEAAFAGEIARREVDGVQVTGGMAAVAVVGQGMAGTPGISGRVFSALAKDRINVAAIAQGSSELNISFVVAAPQMGAALRAVHAAFQLSKIGGGGVAAHGGASVVLLGFGRVGRTLADIMARRKGGPPLSVVAVVDRTGYVFDARGLPRRRLAALAAWKERGKAIARAPGGHKATPPHAIESLGKHALPHPILVDVTADETTPVLVAGLKAGMDVVLANKRPLSGAGATRAALLDAAEAHGRQVRCEATVGAGLPVFDTYAKLVESGDRVLKIEGCVSGTLGFLLSEVSAGRKFSAALRDAMARGYTEPDPRDDLTGADVARKALILGRLIGFAGEPGAVKVENLVPPRARALTAKQFVASLPALDAEWDRRAQAARRRGGVLRYVATVTREKIDVGLRVVDGGSPFGALRGTDNLIAFSTSRYRNPLVIIGAGAGLEVTAGGVLNDILDLAG